MSLAETAGQIVGAIIFIPMVWFGVKIVYKIVKFDKKYGGTNKWQNRDKRRF